MPPIEVDVYQVKAEEGVKLCPILSTAVMVGLLPSKIAGGKERLIRHAIGVACVGSPCEIWHEDQRMERKGCCSLKLRDNNERELRMLEAILAVLSAASGGK